MGWKERFSRFPRKTGNLYSETESLAETADSLPSPKEIAGEIDPAFALEILLHSWDTTLRRAEDYRPYFRPAIKRAIITLHAAPPGRSRSIRKLASLVASCALTQQEEIEIQHLSWQPGPTERTILLQITGESLQSTPFAKELVRDIPASLSFAARRAKGDHQAAHPSDDVMNISHQTSNIADIESFWMGIYVRLATFYRVAQQATNSLEDPTGGFVTLPRGIFIQSTFGDNLDLHLDIYERDLSKHLSYQGTDRVDDLDLVTRPLLELPQGFITSGMLTLDSIAPFALRWIHESGGWRDAISGPFEEKVVSSLRKHGFIAGTLSRKAHWATGQPSTALSKAMEKAAGDCPGEIDAVSFDGSSLQVFECKSIYPFSSLRNTVGRISDEDISGWVSNAQKKIRWLEDATGMTVSFASIIVEGVEYMDLSDPDASVQIMDFKIFSEILQGFPKS